jgi:uncharacterized RDD family membrane protein YckC
MTLATRFTRESYTVDYAGFWLRLLALAIDGAILGTLIWLFNGLWSLAFGRGWMGTAASGGASGVYWFFVILIPFLMVTGYLIGFWRWRGQTPGKMALGLRIVRFNGDAIGWGGAIMRLLGYPISVVPLLIGFIWIGFDTRRQGLHDKLAETYVIRGRPR